MQNMAVEAQGGLIVIAHNDHNPSDAEWDDYLGKVRAMVKVVDGDFGRIRQLVLTDGGHPSSGQRERIDGATREVRNRERAATAVVTESLVARSVVTIFSWFNVRIRAFGPGRLHEAARFLELSALQRELLPQIIERATARVAGGVRSAR